MLLHVVLILGKQIWLLVKLRSIQVGYSGMLQLTFRRGWEALREKHHLAAVQMTFGHRNAVISVWW